MLPLTSLDRECISFLTMVTSPSFPFSWGKIASLLLPSLDSSEIASSINFLSRYSMLPTLCLCLTPTSQAFHTVNNPRTLYQPDPHPILVQGHQWPSEDQRSSSSSSTNGPLKTNDHKRLVSHPQISSFPSTSSGPDPHRALRWPHYVSTSSSPATLVNGKTLQTLLK